MKATERPVTETVVVLEMTRKEAAVLRSLVGCVYGQGSTRRVVDEIFDVLEPYKDSDDFAYFEGDTRAVNK